ncbi:aminoglycoside phosphotransferase family protein [Mycolicibacterium sp. HK-90]|uniref:aminoglycoside phosphotransferase family protein n=1 Tax=Mycolicibacterium sp. HK-90 TaxID=3056937 RepID=UPI0026581E89|nr:aminoglycoside phosphotransferase family protein [Mycolicibacterium sp. HK-90]WKG03771.1 aminoglycoside phosphotransferase family protein [Mycolicibacterium sp. HK-90]
MSQGDIHLDFAVEEVREGQFHRVALGADRVACFPRTPAAAARLAQRAELLRVVATMDLSVAVPEPLAIYSGEPTYLVLTRIPGNPLQRSDLTTPRTIDIVAAQCHELLTRLAAAQPSVRAALPAAAPDRWSRFASAVRAGLYPLMSPAGRDRADHELAAACALPHSTATVVHGDLGGDNLLWRNDAQGPRLSGVIDWDSAMLGDPAEDIAALTASYGRPLLDRLAGSDRELSDRVVAIRDTFALQQALDGQLDGDEGELADGLAGYR